MSSDKKTDKSPEEPRVTPPVDDPERRGDAGRDGKAGNDRGAAEARLRALNFLRRMRRSDAKDHPEE